MIYEKIYIKAEINTVLNEHAVLISSNGYQWITVMSFEKKKDAIDLAKLLSDFCKKKNIRVMKVTKNEMS